MSPSQEAIMVWGGEFWSAGYYANTVGKHGNEKVVAKYVKELGKDYYLLHETKILNSPFSDPNTPPQAAALFIYDHPSIRLVFHKFLAKIQI